MKTPFVQYRCDATKAHCIAIAHRLAEFERGWMPELTRFLPTPVLSVVREVTAAASCRSMDDAVELHAAGFSKILISRPVVDSNSLAQLAELAQSCELTCVADHFRHAELLSNSLRLRNATARLLIDVEVGAQRGGVRPGPDSTRLATAAAQLPGLTIAGVYADDDVCDSGASMLDSHAEGLSLDDIQTVAAHCRRMIQATGIDCQNLVTGRRTFASVLKPCDVTISLFNPLDAAIDAASTNSELNRDQLPVVLISRVLSRPTLETCVIDFGSQCTGRKLPVVAYPKGAVVQRISDDTSTLSLSAASLDLRIGDEVEVMADWRSCLPLASECRTSNSEC